MTTTSLAPRYDPSAIETETYERWLDAGVFGASVDSAKEPYVIVIPPPNVTAVLHTGHGLNNTLQDALIRFERMRGREALWLPGTDHAGIATQNAVERLLAQEGKTRHDLGRERFVDRVWEHVGKTGDSILKQLRAIGCSCDWSRTRFTFDEEYSSAVRKVFVDLHRDGLVYRGQRVIHWCPRCLTSLSDEEAEFRDRDDHLYYIKYRIVHAPDGKTASGEEFVVVATTRPETMFGDVCLVFHPEDERFTGLDGALVEIPLSGVRIPVRTSSAVERDFGTGMLKVTPAHDANDFDIADTLGGFERPSIMTEEATMATDQRVPQQFHGVDRAETRAQLVAALRSANQLEHVDDYRHAVRHCYRCDTIVEPRLSDQWFVRMEPLAAPALAAYREGKLRFVPERWGGVYENWLTQIRDWNISRQLWWGHRIPAWYCEADACQHITVAMDRPGNCEECGGPVHQDEDVLDTWFSSWLWPFATLGWPENTADLDRFYPGSTLVTGPDIIFFWVARMVMSGYRFMGERPFDTVYLNGIVRDTQHRKMSKSAGNGIDPLEVVSLFGADAFRFTLVAGGAAGSDIILDPDDLEASFASGRNFANKIWNIGRFIVANMDGPITPPDDLSAIQLELADRWILARCRRAVESITNAYERFRLNEAANAIYHFVWDELADWYVEQVKPRLYGTAAGGAHARGVLSHVFRTALKLLHPIMPFLTEELWRHMPGAAGKLLASSEWPTPDDDFADAEAEDLFGKIMALITAVRTDRAEYHIPPSTLLRVVVEPADEAARAVFELERETIARLAKVGELEVDYGEPDEVGAHTVLSDGSSVFVPLGDAIDIRKECARLSSEAERLDRQLSGVAAKLKNEKFVSRAPADVVERERAKERSWQEQREVLSAKLRALGC
ncbi:MAG: valine--tRNA ligase [Gemmatimonadales bacterium]